MRITIVALFLSGLLAFGAAAEDAATKDALAQDPNILKSQEPQPDPHGTRPPNPATNADTQSAELQQALAAVRRAPPDLNGNPVPRPNWLASEPDQDNEPTRSQNPSDLSSQEIK
ncbi:hypothetical protein J2847_006530 [Azospirillum agricola]|uniref:hypothetical protein n=1 Tax=Azospirillum agricola TaxID=1720247 RepID=UPI001AE97363|nr:hypothetical protein [Azospirillum agricola]MBP2233195.1 hypothetical protein [Azospirillum agricola]